MYKKIFINIFFEKKRVLVTFILMFTLLLLYSGIQLIFLGQRMAQVAIPDIQINGKIGDDGVFYYRMYNDMDGLSTDVKELVDDEMRVYGITVRNLLTMENPKTFQKIYYMVYGVEDDFFNNELENCLKVGELPRNGKKEVLIGSYAAQYFKVNVGDMLDIGVTLNKEIYESDSMQYVVTGILNDNLEYFAGGIILSKETFEKNNSKVNENLLLAYFKDANSIKIYDEINADLMDLNDKYEFGSVSVNYEQKYNIKNNIIITIVSLLCISSIILFLLISYLMKGITKKIGLLKALGISDRYIIRTFVGGLGLCILISTVFAAIGVDIAKIFLNYNVSSFLGYQVEKYIISPYIHLSLVSLGSILFLMVYLMIKITSSKVSPRDAMLKL